MSPKVSIVIPVKKVNDFLRKETIPALLNQTNQNFEIIIVTDQISKEKFRKTKIVSSWPKPGPADKRDLGAKRSQGEILAFLDDDSYPDKNWLKNAQVVFKKGGKKTAGVCGPQLTPPANNIRQKASGYVWSSWLGSGGAGTYRCAADSKKEVDDFPTVNLLVRKKDFENVGGFDSKFWPGEDTKFCHDLVYKLKKKIIYDPRVLVYHHRRAVFKPHLKQISRYALHRGHFARILPKTSLRIGYFIPSLFVLGLILGLPLSFLHPVLGYFYLGSLFFYLVNLLLVAFRAFLKERNWWLLLLVIAAIFTTHLVYGFLFIKGFITPNLKSSYQR